jgi:hypothetical protein
VIGGEGTRAHRAVASVRRSEGDFRASGWRFASFWLLLHEFPIVSRTKLVLTTKGERENISASNLPHFSKKGFLHLCARAVALF